MKIMFILNVKSVNIHLVRLWVHLELLQNLSQVNHLSYPFNPTSDRILSPKIFLGINETGVDKVDYSDYIDYGEVHHSHYVPEYQRAYQEYVDYQDYYADDR